MGRKILFYDHKDVPYGCFSNFSPHPIVMEGKTWPTSEHFFQAMKSEDPAVQEHIRGLSSPGKAKNYGNEQVQLRADWNDPVGTPELHARFRDAEGIVVHVTKDHFMLAAVSAKFTQHAALREVLLGTGDDEIIENTHSVGSDPYWGNGPSFIGLNKLGRMLMLIRGVFRAKA